MSIMIISDEHKRPEFAFTKFFSRKYPVYASKRLHTSAHNDSLHNHDFPQFWYCMEGRYLHQVGGQVYECDKGSVIMVPPGVFHEFRVREEETVELLELNVMYDTFLYAPCDRYLNAIAALFLPPFAEELGYSFPTCQMLSRESQAALEEYTSWLSLLSFVEPGNVVETDILEKLEALFSLPELALLESYRDKAMQLIPDRLLPMLQMLSYLNNHYKEKLIEEMLSREMGISRTNFFRFFKRYSGYTYAQYLQMLRAKHAHIYLSRTTYPISYISDMCGFCNTQHMSRIYKKYTGRTPRESRLLLYEKYHTGNQKNKFRVI